ncbi:MAG: winged helix-turn-helix domain-containing protein [Proteobacteria bacterium]|nr:winged helix-turn-helix domain-containing protein [Pseudomonadota bacterium]
MSAIDPRLAEAFPGVAFTRVEQALLGYLFGTRHRYANKGELLREVWGYSPKTRTRTVESTVQRVRAKIEPNPSKPAVLLNVRGQGYQLNPPGAQGVSEEIEALRKRLAALIGEGQTIVAVLTAEELGASLPVERDAWVGREPALAEALQLLCGTAQWLTLLGGPGVGKTRLAGRIARAWLNEERGDAWFCDLSEARTVDAFWSQLARVLGVVAVGQSDVSALVVRALAARSPGLLVLDNVEQLADVVARAVPRLQSASAELRVLATSRERLRVGGEHVLALDPLVEAEGQALFLARAEAVRPGIELDADTVNRVVRRLDGVPLALELAAARLRFTPLEQLAERLDEHIGELASDRRDAIGRQSSLAQAIAWSWELLSADEQQLLGELSGFRGGATLESMAAICTAGEESQLLAGALLDKSMLRAVPGPTGLRFSSLESVRQFAREHTQADVRSSASARHAAWFALRAEAAAAAYDFSPEGGRFLRDELDNVLAALEHMTWLGVPQAAALANHLWPVQLSHGLPSDYLQRLDQVLAIPDLSSDDQALMQLRKIDVLTSLDRPFRSDDQDVVEALPELPEGSILDVQHIKAKALMLQREGRLAEGLELSLRGIRLAAQGGWVVREAKMEVAAGVALHYLLRVDEALEHYRRAVDLATGLGALRVAAVAWGNVGACLDDPDAREEALQKAEELALRFDDLAVLHSIKSVRASRCLEAGQLEEADTLYEELFDEVRRVGGRAVAGTQRVNAGLLSLMLGRWDEGVSRLSGGLARIGRQSSGVLWTLGLAYLGVAQVRSGDEEGARQTFERVGLADEGLGPQVGLAVRLCRAHVPGLEDLDAVLDAARQDPALAGLVQILEGATSGA